MRRLRGTVAAALTPLTAGGRSVDEAAISPYVEFLVAGRLDGVLTFGTNGEAVLKVSDRKDKMSSLSDEWREAVSTANQNYAGMWNREVTVPMLTMDALVERFGLPFYIKIDVEGYEDQVIAGLTECP